MTTPDTRTAATPHRLCIGCRTSRPQHELVRCALDHPNVVVSRTAPGRGAWLCSLECFDVATKRRSFERAWKRPVEADPLATLRIAFERVITNMTELPVVGDRPDQPVPTKG